MTQRSSHRRPKAEIIKVSAQDTAFVRSLLVHEDNDILVFNKPSGLSVQGGSGITRDLDHLLWAFANRKGRRPKLVHRLDRETSGVIVVAKTTPAAAELSTQFANRSTQKTYLALACGQPKDASGLIDLPLLRYTSSGIDLVRVAQIDDPLAQSAQTSWRTISGNQTASVIEAKPQSGRMHQIRAHLAELGHPIAGDTKYGGMMSLAGKLVPRLMLHAKALTFAHPATGEVMTFEAHVPEDFAFLLAQIGISDIVER
jgi:23S rRNA pseudouridine955/2504/2580 synthase